MWLVIVYKPNELIINDVVAIFLFQWNLIRSWLGALAFLWCLLLGVWSWGRFCFLGEPYSSSCQGLAHHWWTNVFLSNRKRVISPFLTYFRVCLFTLWSDGIAERIYQVLVSFPLVFFHIYWFIMHSLSFDSFFPITSFNGVAVGLWEICFKFVVCKVCHLCLFFLGWLVIIFLVSFCDSLLSYFIIDR